MTEPAPIHPVAPRLKTGPKIPHIGPDINAYRSAHEKTLGHESDKWWAKVWFGNNLHQLRLVKNHSLNLASP